MDMVFDIRTALELSIYRSCFYRICVGLHLGLLSYVDCEMFLPPLVISNVAQLAVVIENCVLN